MVLSLISLIQMISVRQRFTINVSSEDSIISSFLSENNQIVETHTYPHMHTHRVAVHKFLFDSNKQPEAFPLQAVGNKLLSGFFSCFLYRFPF